VGNDDIGHKPYRYQQQVTTHTVFRREEVRRERRRSRPKGIVGMQSSECSLGDGV